MAKQWIFVLSVLGALIVGIAALAWFGPEVEPVAVGRPAPDYRAVDLRSGDTVSIRTHYRGKVTLVNIWATWCVPCEVEMPAMQRLYDSLGSRGLHIAAVSIDESGPETVKRWIAERKLTFEFLHDRSGRIKDAYQTTGVPESFLLNKRGIIMKRVIGAHDWSSPVNLALIERLLAEPD